MVYLHRFLFLLLFISPACLNAQPCPRNQPVISYHENDRSIYLFAGYCSLQKKRLNDLWAYDGQTWKKIQSENSPPARSGHSMIYDQKKGLLVVFGGKAEDGKLLNDLWSWDGKKWDLISQQGPSPRQSHRLVYNSSNGQYFLFGGSNEEKEAQNDTWIFEKGTWTKIASSESPPARLQHTLAYDEQRKKMVLFGGFQKVENEKTVFGDTWEWDEKIGWKLKASNNELARDHHAMVYDKSMKAILLFGGYNNGYLGDTRTWDGETWQLKTEEGPSKRAGKPGLIFHSSKNKSILFGGWDKNNTPLMDFWIFDGRTNTWIN